MMPPSTSVIEWLSGTPALVIAISLGSLFLWISAAVFFEGDRRTRPALFAISTALCLSLANYSNVFRWVRPSLALIFAEVHWWFITIAIAIWFAASLVLVPTSSLPTRLRPYRRAAVIPAVAAMLLATLAISIYVRDGSRTLLHQGLLVCGSLLRLICIGGAAATIWLAQRQSTRSSHSAPRLRDESFLATALAGTLILAVVALPIAGVTRLVLPDYETRYGVVLSFVTALQTILPIALVFVFLRLLSTSRSLFIRQVGIGGLLLRAALVAVVVILPQPLYLPTLVGGALPELALCVVAVLIGPAAIVLFERWLARSYRQLHERWSAMLNAAIDSWMTFDATGSRRGLERLLDQLTERLRCEACYVLLQIDPDGPPLVLSRDWYGKQPDPALDFLGDQRPPYAFRKIVIGRERLGSKPRSMPRALWSEWYTRKLAGIQAPVAPGNAGNMTPREVGFIAIVGPKGTGYSESDLDLAEVCGKLIAGLHLTSMQRYQLGSRILELEDYQHVFDSRVRRVLVRALCSEEVDSINRVVRTALSIPDSEAAAPVVGAALVLKQSLSTLLSDELASIVAARPDLAIEEWGSDQPSVLDDGTESAGRPSTFEDVEGKLEWQRLPPVLGRVGLIAAIQQVLIPEFNSPSLNVDQLEVEELDDEFLRAALSSKAQRWLYRAVREAVRNARQHGGGTAKRPVKVEIWLGRDRGDLIVDVANNGNVFQASAALLNGDATGIAVQRAGLRQLAGTFAVHAGPGGVGTLVHMRLPLRLLDSMAEQVVLDEETWLQEVAKAEAKPGGRLLHNDILSDVTMPREIAVIIHRSVCNAELREERLKREERRKDFLMAQIRAGILCRDLINRKLLERYLSTGEIDGGRYRIPLHLVRKHAEHVIDLLGQYHSYDLRITNEDLGINYEVKPGHATLWEYRVEQGQPERLAEVHGVVQTRQAIIKDYEEWFERQWRMAMVRDRSAVIHWLREHLPPKPSSPAMPEDVAPRVG